MAQYELKEQHMRKKKRESAWCSEGIILEEAAQRVGSEERLRQAVDRGAIKVISQSGVQLFVFPRANSLMAEGVM